MAKAATTKPKRKTFSSGAQAKQKYQRIIIYAKHDGGFSIRNKNHNYATTNDLAELLHYLMGTQGNSHAPDHLIIGEDLTEEQFNESTKEANS